MKKFISIVLVLALAFSLCIPSLAAKNKNVTITYREIKIFINGEQINPKDASGASTEPFILDGSTFLPVRAVSGALGLEVGWDADTNTVTLDSASSAPSGPSAPAEPSYSNKAGGIGTTIKTLELAVGDVGRIPVRAFVDGPNALVECDSDCLITIWIPWNGNDCTLLVKALQSGTARLELSLEGDPDSVIFVDVIIQ